jgi:hypothetical protein
MNTLSDRAEHASEFVILCVFSNEVNLTFLRIGSSIDESGSRRIGLLKKL